MTKRLFDVCLAALLALPSLLVVLLAAAVIRIDSPGPALFRQLRVGRNRKSFVLVKLRTMRSDTRDCASHEVSPAQVTAVGRWLRRTKLDELPQIWSVLKGDMSFVGPRPCLPIQVELIEARERLGVFSVRPGITGRAQLSGVDMSTPHRLASVDADYVRERSLAGDLKLLIDTGLGRGAGDAIR